MRIWRTVGLCLLSTVLLAVAVPPASAAGDGIDAVVLYDHEESITLGQPVNMWECWKAGPGTNPRLSQKIGKKWVLLDVSTVTRDEDTCGRKKPIKAVYTFTVNEGLRWSAREQSYEAIVKTECSTCVTYNWSILVDKNS